LQLLIEALEAFDNDRRQLSFCLFYFLLGIRGHDRASIAAQR
jgi:hypothetical protein